MRYLAYVLATVLAATVASATGVTTWNGTYETGTFSDATLVNQMDDLIDQVLESVRERGEVESCWGSTSLTGCPATADTGRAREGAARAYHVADCAVVANLNATDAQGAIALGAGDDGRLCINSATHEAFYWNGSSWVSVAGSRGLYGAAAKNTGAETIASGATASIGFDSEAAGGYDLSGWHDPVANTCASGTAAGCRFTVPIGVDLVIATCNVQFDVTTDTAAVVRIVTSGTDYEAVVQPWLTDVSGATDDGGVNLVTGPIGVTAGDTLECTVQNRGAGDIDVLATTSWMTVQAVSH